MPHRTDSDDRKMLPIRISLSGKSVLLIDSSDGTFPEEAVSKDGKVSFRAPCDKAAKVAAYLADFTDDLAVLSFAPSQNLMSFCKEHGIPLIAQPYTREYLYGRDYVFCVSDDERTIRDVAAVCRTMGIFLCIAGRPDQSDFQMEL